MRKRTLHYMIAGAAAVVIVVGIVIARRGVSSPPVEQAPDRVVGPIARGVPLPAKLITEPVGDLTGSDEGYQMNPPEAGLAGPPNTASPAIEKNAGAVAAPAVPAARSDGEWLKPAPVDSKNLPLGPLVSPSILVEKGALRLTVFDGDAGVKSYRIATGTVQGDKNCEGDRKTPEGDFYICIRKTAGQTPYTRSLGLSYPNLEDAQRGRRDGLITKAQHYSIAQAIKNRRKPPWQTKLGGAIMIHGKREGRTGTLGCVALDDADIIELYNRLPLNTPVRIIP